jgi:hypothetical protein
MTKGKGSRDEKKEQSKGAQADGAGENVKGSGQAPKPTGDKGGTADGAGG